MPIKLQSCRRTPKSAKFAVLNFESTEGFQVAVLHVEGDRQRLPNCGLVKGHRRLPRLQSCMSREIDKSCQIAVLSRGTPNGE